MKTFDDLRTELKKRNPDEFFKMEIVGKILAARDRKGWSQRELSRISGIPQKTISRIENGKDIPNLRTLLTLCNYLDLEISLVDKETKDQQSATILV